MSQGVLMVLYVLAFIIKSCLGSDNFMCDFMQKGYHKYAEKIIPDAVVDHFLQLADTSLKLPKNKSDLYFRTNKIHLQFEDLMWPNGIIPIEFGIGKRYEGRIWKILKAITDNSCITFVKKDESHEDFVHLKMAHYMSTYIGRIGGRQDATVEFIAAHQILHVFMHILGFVHQHQSQDRDNFVIIQHENIKDGFQKDFQKFNDLDQSFGATYEYDSVTHYPRNVGAVDEDEDTIVAKDPDMELEGSYILSPGDVWRINAMYQCPDYIDLNVSC